MYDTPAIDPFAILALVAVWGLVGVGLLVWYLWAMARLFPRIGLKKRDGWIPIWNQWQLLERAGMPGWTAQALCPSSMTNPQGRWRGTSPGDAASSRTWRMAVESRAAKL